MLRDDHQIQLNDLLVRITETADLAAFGRSAPELEPLLSQLEGRMRSAAERVEEMIRATGDLPDAPDADLESARKLRIWMEGVITADRHHAVIAAIERALAGARATCAEVEQSTRGLPCGELADLDAMLHTRS